MQPAGPAPRCFHLLRELEFVGMIKDYLPEKDTSPHGGHPWFQGGDTGARSSEDVCVQWMVQGDSSVAVRQDPAMSVSVPLDAKATSLLT
jgi:hypothetical protein